MNWDLLFIESSKLFFGGVVGTIATTFYKDFKDKKNERKRMFLRMIEAKSYIQMPQYLINDLNMLPVLFRREKNVLAKYKLYYADLCLPKDQVDYVRQQGLYWDLLRAMGNAVDYKHLDNDLLSSRYIPTAAVDSFLSQKEFQDTLLPYLKKGIELQSLLVDFYKQYGLMPPPSPPQLTDEVLVE